MSNTPLHYQSLTEVSDRIHRQELSSSEVTLALLERIDALDNSLHAYSALMRETALTTARTADKEISAGNIRSPLHGVPIAVKDLCRTQGVRTRAGMPLLNIYIPDYDSTAEEQVFEVGRARFSDPELL